MEKNVLLKRLVQLKKDVDSNKGLINEDVVALSNQLINYAKEYYKEELSDLEAIKCERGSWHDVRAKLGQAIAVFETNRAEKGTLFD